MDRLADLMQSGAYAQGRAPMANVAYGANFGATGPAFSEWASNTRYIRQNLVCLLLQAPGFMRYMPEGQKYIAHTRQMVEVHARVWDGLKGGLEVEWNETPVGGAGEMHQDVINVTRERSTPTMTLDDRYGRPFQNLLQDWILYGMGDPDNKIAQVMTLSRARPEDMMADMAGATMLFYEPDPSNLYVSKAWLCANMMPKNMGPYEGKKDFTASKEAPELSIEFSATTQQGEGVRLFAQALLERMSIVGTTPTLRPAFLSAISADVEAAVDVGYKTGIERAAAQTVRRL